MKHTLMLIASLAGVSALAAAPISFDFKDPKGVNQVQFHLDAPLEAISGTANGVSGTVSFDPANPAGTSGRIVVSAPSLTVPNGSMQDHLHGARWLDSKTHGEISFELVSLSDVKTEGTTTTAKATGKFTLKGVTKELVVPVRLTFLADAYGKRINKPDMKGDLLVVRSEFTVLRSDFGVNAGQNEDKVANEIKLSLSIAGSAPRA
jgi:polyisoprenoid-binding protein YceI